MPCPYCRSSDLVSKKGVYSRKTGPQRRIQRYYCRACRRHFSELTGCLAARHRRPELNAPIYHLLVSGVSQRRTARLLRTTQTTVARKLVHIAIFARHFQAAALQATAGSVHVAVFDEMETFEHSKLKPLAIALAVDDASRRILGVAVASMPAKGRLAAAARQRYGYRPDHRSRALAAVLSQVSQVGGANLVVKCDQCPRYPRAVARHIPRASLRTFKGRRACVVGQGELKRGGFDPLFSLNHTCAMNRDNLKRLSRRTWCTTKRPDRLQCLVDLYACAHNDEIALKLKPHGKLTPKPFLALEAAAKM